MNCKGAGSHVEVTAPYSEDWVGARSDGQQRWQRAAWDRSVWGRAGLGEEFWRTLIIDGGSECPNDCAMSPVASILEKGP